MLCGLSRWKEAILRFFEFVQKRACEKYSQPNLNRITKKKENKNESKQFPHLQGPEPIPILKKLLVCTAFGKWKFTAFILQPFALALNFNFESSKEL